MRYTFGAALAAAAICGASVGSAVAEPVHYAGGPTREGDLCWVNGSLPNINDLGFGHWESCPATAHIHHKKK